MHYPDTEAGDFQRKLELINNRMTNDRQYRQVQHLARYSEDSDYTSDLNYPITHNANSSASHYRNLQTPQRSLETSRENSYEKEDRYGYYDTTTANTAMTNFTSLNMEIENMYPEDSRSPIRDKEESDPLSYNSRPFNTNSCLKGLSETRYDRSDGYTGIRKRSLERQHSSVLFDNFYGDQETNDYETSLYPTRNANEPQLVNRYDYSYGLDRQWNTNSINFNSNLPSKGKLLPKVPTKSYNVIEQREATSTLLTDAIPIASGLSKKTRQLPQPVVSATRKRLPRAGYTRQLPQMPSINKSKYPASLMSRSDTEYSKFGSTEDFERRGAMSAMQYNDYSFSPTLRTYEPYDDTAKSMNEPPIFHSNESLNTTAQSVYSEFSTATDRRSKMSVISNAVPVASSLTNNFNQVTDSYQNYTSSTSRKRLPQIPAVPNLTDATSANNSNFEPTIRSTGKRLPDISALSTKAYITSSSYQHLETTTSASGPQLYSTTNITNTTNNNDIKINLSNNNRLTYDTCYRYNLNSSDSTYDTSDKYVPENSTYDCFAAKSVTNDIYDTDNSLTKSSIVEPPITDATSLITPYSPTFSMPYSTTYSTSYTTSYATSFTTASTTLDSTLYSNSYTTPTTYSMLYTTTPYTTQNTTPIAKQITPTTTAINITTSSSGTSSLFSSSSQATANFMKSSLSGISKTFSMFQSKTPTSAVDNGQQQNQSAIGGFLSDHLTGTFGATETSNNQQNIQNLQSQL
ncbi:mucin-4-like, partial [Contarinia nasturtii]|uniref:mucin-4-like n=1 Tax=Contarinia nasturtii TaxID=265458 RepID=UPI0012D39FC0